MERHEQALLVLHDLGLRRRQSHIGCTAIPIVGQQHSECGRDGRLDCPVCERIVTLHTSLEKVPHNKRSVGPYSDGCRVQPVARGQVAGRECESPPNEVLNVFGRGGRRRRHHQPVGDTCCASRQCASAVDAAQFGQCWLPDREVLRLISKNATAGD